MTAQSTGAPAQSPAPTGKLETAPVASIGPSQTDEPVARPIRLIWTRLDEFDKDDTTRPHVGTRFGDRYLLGGLEVDRAQGLGWNGALWSSVDGLVWRDFDPGIDLTGSPISAIASDGVRLVAAGPAAFCFMHCDTGWLADQGSTVYQASQLQAWTRLARPTGLEHGLAGDLAFLDGRIISVGSVNNPDRPKNQGPYPDGTESVAMAWTSTDGMTWQPAQGIPSGRQSGPLAVSGQNAVALLSGDFDQPDVLIWSGDGLAWTETGSIADLETVIAFPGGFRAYGFSDDQASVYTSADGRDWARGDFDPPVSFWHGSVAWIGRAFVGLGERASGFGDGWQNSVWTSAEGLTWEEHDPPEQFLSDASFHVTPFPGFALVTAFGPGGYRVWHVAPE